MRYRTSSLAACVAAVMACFPAYAGAQDRTAAVRAGAQYEAGGAVEFLAGSGWRALWVTPVRAPVLDLDTAGGLRPDRQGGRQSHTLHFKAGNGRQYVFRSADKFLHKEALPEALRHTPVGDVVQDQISTLFPAAGLVVGPLYEAMGLLHPTPRLVVLPDDPRLGEFRDLFAGMLGQFEENPQEGPDETPGFAGSRRIVGGDRMVERLDESYENRIHLPEYLAARLIQFMIADTDRGSDQWRFARLDVNGETLFRPIARDHDFAFMQPNGLFGTISRMGYPKLSKFDGTYESMRTLTFMTREMDRRILAGLPRASWDSVVAAMRAQITDDVIRAAVNRLPVEYQQIAGAKLIEGMRMRRDALPEVAAEFYRMIFREVDVHASAEDEHAEVERFADGSVELRLYGGTPAAMVASAQPAAGQRGSAPQLILQRRYVPTETHEIRLYMHGGDDVVRITGVSNDGILLRVIGGNGDDVLVDSARVNGARTILYTARGSDRVVRGPATRIDDRDYAEMLPGRPLDLARRLDKGEPAFSDDDDDEDEDAAAEAGIDEDVSERLGGDTFRDWGGSGGTGPAFDFRSRSGLLVGVGRSFTRYGFRREPHKYHVSGNAFYAVDTGGFGLELHADRRAENSSRGLSLDASATQYESFRFFGYGNDTDGDVTAPRVTRDQVTVRPALFWQRGGTYFGIGPIFRWGDPRFDAGSPLDVSAPIGSGSYAQAGGLAQFSVERGTSAGSDPRGISINASASAYPELLDVAEPFGSVDAHARAFVPLPGRPFAAFRAGGRMLWGDAFPVHEAAFIGGRTTLRGYTTDRFAGDASVYGSSELHLPLFTTVLLVRGQVGVFGLADAGRVYVDGASPGGWHTSYGGGVWFASLSRMVSLSYAHGERGRLYLRLGTPL